MVNNKTKVSIIIPVFNVAEYIEKCLYSVIQQKTDNIECLLVDDCGTDNSIAIAEKIINQYNGPISFKVLHHDHNRGLSAARNTGIDNATGEYLFFLDSDDEIAENAIEALLSEAQERPDVEIIVGNMYSVPHNDFYELNLQHSPYRITGNHQIRNAFFCKQPLIPVMACNKLIKRDYIIKNKLFFKEGIIHEDELWMFNTINHINNVSLINNYTYIRYLRPNSITTTSSQQNSANHMAKIILEILHKIASPCREMQFLFYTRYYFNHYPYIRHTKEYKSICFGIYIALNKHRHYKAALMFLTHCYSNKIVFKLKYEIIPNLLEKATNKDKFNIK